MTRDIEAGDVLHHLAAEPEQPAFAVEDLHAEHEVAHGADAGAARPREAGGDNSTDGGARAEGRRLEGQHLPPRRQRRLDVGQRRAAARSDHQLGRLVMLGTLASPDTFGNYGAGTTLYWVDPVRDISFVFLSAGLMESNANTERFQRLSDIVLSAAL